MALGRRSGRNVQAADSCTKLSMKMCIFIPKAPYQRNFQAFSLKIKMLTTNVIFKKIFMKILVGATFEARTRELFVKRGRCPQCVGPDSGASMLIFTTRGAIRLKV